MTKEGTKEKGGIEARERNVENGKVRTRRVKMVSLSCWRIGSVSWWRELEDRKENQGNWKKRGGTRDSRQKETKEIRSGEGTVRVGRKKMTETGSGDGTAKMGGTRWNVGRRSIPG